LFPGVIGLGRGCPTYGGPDSANFYFWDYGGTHSIAPAEFQGPDLGGGGMAGTRRRPSTNQLSNFPTWRFCGGARLKAAGDLGKTGHVPARWGWAGFFFHRPRPMLQTGAGGFKSSHKGWVFPVGDRGSKDNGAFFRGGRKRFPESGFWEGKGEGGTFEFYAGENSNGNRASGNFGNSKTTVNRGAGRGTA